MSRTLVLTDHLSTEQLAQRMRAASDARLRARYQVIYLVSRGQSAPTVAATVGYSANWVRSLVYRYNAQGEAGLIDGRTHNAGKPPYLSPAQQAELKALLQQRAEDGGLWNGPKVTQWIQAKTQRAHVSARLGWHYLERLGFTAQHPRPRHQQADAQQQEAFKKN